MTNSLFFLWIAHFYEGPNGSLSLAFPPFCLGGPNKLIQKTMHYQGSHMQYEV